MSNLDELYQQIRGLPNGEIVAKKLVQLLDFSLGEENSYSASMVTKIRNIIASCEEKLLKRPYYQVHDDRYILKRFNDTLSRSTEQERADFKQRAMPDLDEITDISDLIEEERDLNYLTRDESFYEWILGVEGKGGNPEQEW